MECILALKADFHSPISGTRDFLRLIVDLGMRTNNKKHVSMIARSPETVEGCSTFFEKSPVVVKQKNRSFRK